VTLYRLEDQPMPWRERSAMDVRVEFVLAVLRNDDSLTALSEQYGISRKTGHKWCERYRLEVLRAWQNGRTRRSITAG
jgi:transposase-like protein